MKRCSTCNRTYTDPNLSFCIDDGTPLTEVDPQDESTVVTPGDRAADRNWNEAAYRPPTAHVPSGTQSRGRRVWPWVLGLGGAFVFGMLAISIAVALLAPRLIRTGQNERLSTTEQTKTDQAENSNSVEPANSNTESDVNIEVPPPLDHDQVLAQLRDLENDWTVANINDDKEALERILADDFVVTTREGRLQSKAETIQTNRRDTRVVKWDFDDLKLTLLGDRARLSGKIMYEIQDGDDLKFDFIDNFVWRDGRWQATGSQVTPGD